MEYLPLLANIGIERDIVNMGMCVEETLDIVIDLIVFSTSGLLH
jgi:hypothetical protein